MSLPFSGTANILESHINVTEYSDWLIRFSLRFNPPQVPIQLQAVIKAILL